MLRRDQQLNNACNIHFSMESPRILQTKQLLPNLPRIVNNLRQEAICSEIVIIFKRKVSLIPQTMSSSLLLLRITMVLRGYSVEEIIWCYHQPITTLVVLLPSATRIFNRIEIGLCQVTYNQSMRHPIKRTTKEWLVLNIIIVWAISVSLVLQTRAHSSINKTVSRCRLSLIDKL